MSTPLPPPPVARPPGGPPPGWYRDPWGQAVWRWWDGRAWTGYTDATVSPWRAAPARPADPTVPMVAGVWGLVVLVALLVGLRPVVSALLRTDWPVVVLVALSVIGVYAPMLAYCWYASRRWGTGSWSSDYGWQFRPIDLAWGLAAFVGAIAAQFAASVLIVLLDLPFGSNTDGIVTVREDRAVYLTLAAAAVVVAPIVEELFFRGLVARALRSRLGAVASVGAQGVLFGAYHVDPYLGAGNVGLVVALSLVGVVWGVVAWWVRRLAPTVLGHALMNAMVFLVLLAD